MKRHRSRGQVPRRAGDHDTRLGFALTHVACVLLGLLVAAAAGWWALPFKPDPVRSTEPHRVAPKPALSGPWGEIELTEIELMRPEDSLPAVPSPVPPTTWFFRDHTEAQVLALLRQADVTVEQQRLLTDPRYWTRATNGWLLLPPPEAVRTLGPQARKRIYNLLRLYPENPLHCNMTRVPVKQFDHWLDEGGLPPDKKELLRSLTYVDDGVVCFADFELMESLCSLPERRRFAIAMSQAPGLYMKLRVGPETDLDALLRYWGQGGRGRAMRPFLEALKRVPGGSSLGVSFFFPTFARTRLYTYPEAHADGEVERQDCFWTAMNFFNERPDARFFDGGFIQRTLDEQYTPAPTNWTFGDVLAVFHGEEVNHMCVYIAAEVVFTKNGLNPLEPWRLMRIPDLMRCYGNHPQARILGFRRKDRPHVAAPAPQPAMGPRLAGASPAMGLFPA